jgi:hypothetical protein
MNLTALLKQLGCCGREGVILVDLHHQTTSLVNITDEMLTDGKPAVEGYAFSRQCLDHIFVSDFHGSNVLICHARTLGLARNEIVPQISSAMSGQFGARFRPDH